MSAFGTKKRGADRGVQLTFPTVFEYTYDEPLAYAPGVVGAGPDLPMGDDFQANWHEQKRMDANRMAMAKVESTHNARLRAMTGHAGFHLPAPVLGQRKFANPSGGALQIPSARHDYRDAPFHWDLYSGAGLVGGVLRSAEGQAYGRRILQDRIRQLNNIASAKVAFQMAGETAVPAGIPTAPAPPPEPFRAEEGLPVAQEIELDSGLNAIVAKLQTPQSARRLAQTLLADSIRLFQLLIRDAQSDAGTPTQGQNAQTTLQSVEEIIRLVGAFTDEDRDDFGGPGGFTQADVDLLTLAESYWKTIQEYLTNMIAFFNAGSRSKKDTESASKAFIKESNIRRLLRDAEAVRAQPQPEQWMGVNDLDVGPVGQVYPDLAGIEQMAGLGKGKRKAKGMAEAFTRRAPTREDAEHGETQTETHRRVAYDPDLRQSFGYSSGEFYATGGRDVGFVGEESVPYGSEDYKASEEMAIPRLASEEMSLRRVYDPATQTYDVATSKQGLGRKRVPRGKKTASANVIVETFMAPKNASELPNTLEGFKELAKRHNATGSGKQIRINKNSTLANVRRNFIRRFGLKKS